MNAPFALQRIEVRQANLSQQDEALRIEAFVRAAGGSIFHCPAWLVAVEEGTRQHACGLVAEQNGEIVGWLPLTLVHSPVFGRVLASSGFAVEGGVLSSDERAASALLAGAREQAHRLSCPSVELRGGPSGEGWVVRSDSHCGFVMPLAADDEMQLGAIPRKQRAEIRKSLSNDFVVTTGTSEDDRTAHYAVYAQSVRNLGTPVFPRSLFDAVLRRLDADILTVRCNGAPVASVLSLYHEGAVMPYWGGGTAAARALRGNDRMYFELMRHARQRGCDRFDFGRSKTGSGPYNYKKTWGFEPQKLSYASWTAPGMAARDADPASAKHAAQIALWKRLPLPIANRLGPLIAKGLG